MKNLDPTYDDLLPVKWENEISKLIDKKKTKQTKPKK